MLNNSNGNIFALLFAVVGLAGVIAAASMQMITGPITTATRATNNNMIGTQLLINARLIVMNAITLPAGGDSDIDGIVEPIEYVPDGTGGCTIALSGGGCLPMTLGASLADPYGTSYGYCVWDHGLIDNGHGDGGSAAPYRLQGGTDPAMPVVALISAGPDKVFQTVCRAFDGVGTDGPDKPVGSDDFLFTYTYAEASAAAAGLWTLKVGSPETAEIAMDLEIKDAGGNVTVAVDHATGIGDFLGITTDLITAKTGNVIDIAGNLRVGTGHVITNSSQGALVFDSGDAGVSAQAGFWFRTNPVLGENTGLYTDLMRITPSGYVGILTTAPASTLDVNGGVRVGDDPEDCILPKAGTIRYSGGAPAWEYCDGSEWLPFRHGGEQVAKLIASDGEAGDNFSVSTAISGDVALIGAYLDDDNGADSGSAYIFIRQNDGAWIQHAKLTASDGAAGDYFGASIAISGDVALIGASLDDDKGSAYIFIRQSDSSWTQDAKLTASDGAASDYFGRAVAISGDVALIGADADDDNGTGSGSAYIFARQNDGSWTQNAKLTASDGADSDYFGRAVAISGDVAVIGAFADDDNGTDSGSAYIFARQNDGSWAQHAKLTASDGAAGDSFGLAVAISGGVALIGAYTDDDNGPASGSAYIFIRQNDGSWTHHAKLIASDGATSDLFGRAVAVSGDVALIGAYADDDKGTDSGSAYIFIRQNDGTWTQQAKLTASDGAAGDLLGLAVAISGDVALIGARFDDDNGNESGSAYIMHRHSWLMD